MRFERSTRPKIMVPLRGGALRAGPTRIVEIPSSTARSVWDYTTSELRTLNVRDTAGSGKREKKKQTFFSGWLRAPDDGGDYQVTKAEYTRREKRVKEKTLRGRYSCVELLIRSVVMGASGDWSVGPGTARGTWKHRRRSRHSAQRTARKLQYNN